MAAVYWRLIQRCMVMVCQAASSLLACNLAFSAYMLRNGPPLIAFFSTLAPLFLLPRRNPSFSYAFFYFSAIAPPVSFNTVQCNFPFHSTPPFFSPAHIQQFSQLIDSDQIFFSTYAQFKLLFLFYFKPPKNIPLLLAVYI